MIKKLTIHHFKSLADVPIDFEPVTLLVGPNGAGKSNVIDVLRFLRDCMTHGLDHAISNRGGMKLLRQYSPRRPFTLSIEVEYESLIGDKYFPMKYSIRLSGSNDNPIIEEEVAQIYEYVPYFGQDGEVHIDDVKQVNFYRDKNGNLSFDGKKTKNVKLLSDEIGLSYISKSFSHDPERLVFLDTGIVAFSWARFISIYPNILRDPAKLDPDKRLKEDCTNWASVIKYLRQSDEGRKAWSRIKEYLSYVLPGFEDIAVKTVGGHLSPQFKVKVPNSDQTHFLDPLQLSDGTLRLVGLFLALYQEPKPILIALEEPELTVHPGVLKLLSEAIREVSRSTQLVITSHSPHLLDYFEIDEIRVVEMNKGVTTVGKIREQQREAVLKKLMSISEIMAFDGLQISN